METASNASPEIVDIVFQNLESRDIPSKSDLGHNLQEVALAATAPALSLSLFCNVLLAEESLTPTVKVTAIHLLIDSGDLFLRWVHFCL